MLASAVLSRMPKKNYQYELEVFWSNKNIAAGNIFSLLEKIDTDGFRGEANKTLTVECAYKIGRFVGWYHVPSGRMVVAGL